jgi:hypothetical protein
VRPLADELLKQVGGSYEQEVECGDVAWSNELALHVIEIKTNGPAPALEPLAIPFQANIERIHELLAPMDARLLPTAMHPWMDPSMELKLWPHENDVIYKTFDRIFDCRGHGWANLQSTHINLPFGNDREFGALHAAIRLVLPLIPGLAASSPLVGGQPSGLLDNRLEFYRNNAARVPSVAGSVVPERVYTRKEYETDLLGRIYRDLKPLDPDGVLRHEWVNSRGAIARFDRMAIEIRVIDIQECPAADIAVAAAIVAAVRALVEEHWCSTRAQRIWETKELAHLLQLSLRDADETLIENPRLLECFGFPERGRARLIDLWQHLIEALLPQPPAFTGDLPPLDVILDQGCLARRILRALDGDSSQERVREVYTALADCLAQGQSYTAG